MKKKDRVKRSGAGTGARSEAAPRDPIPTHADLVVVGGGPHAVALVTRILTRGEVLTDANGPLTGYRKSPKDVRRHLFRTPVDESLKRSIVVIDKSGGWMLNWQRQYRAFGIEHLRSPESLHPDPYDHSALRVWANQVKLEKDQFVDMKVLSQKRKPTDGNGRGRRRGGGTSLGVGHFRGPFTLPTVDVFAEFSSHLIDAAYGLGPLLREGEVTGMTPLAGTLRGRGRDEKEDVASTDDRGDSDGDTGGGEVSAFELTVSLPDGGTTRITAGTVVMARGPTSRRRIPDWAKPFFHDTTTESTSTASPNHRGPRVSRSSCSARGPPRFAIAHAWDIIGSNATIGLTSRKQAASSAHEQAVAPTDRVLVVGGGLTSAHLVVLLANRGVKDITLIFRGPRKVKNFDLPLPWFGDDRWDKRREFESASWPERLRALKEERDGGSLTPELDAKIRALETKGVCVVREYTEVRAASWIDHNNADPNPHPDERGDCTVGGDGGGGHFEICLDDDTGLRVERIWLATGSLSGVEDDPLFERVLAKHPVAVRNGFPELTRTLRWSKNVPLYLMGGLAAMQLGPDAVNLAGGLRGALRISDEVKQRMLELRPSAARTNAGTATSIESDC